MQPDLRVLFVDDEPMFLALLKPMIKNFDLNLQVDAAASPKDVIDALQRIHYDCVIVDYYMPRTSGLHLIKKIKTIRNTPCILYTGLSVDEIEEEARNAGVDAIMSKIDNPNDYSVLTQLIRDTVSQHRARMYQENHEVKVADQRG